jgi:hypothetical protein
MKDRSLILIVVLALVSIAASPPNFTGEFADRKFLDGQAVFELSVEQNGSTVSVFFTAVYSDGHGAAPEANATGEVNSKGIVEFKFEDSFSNTGTGTIKRAGDDVIVSFKMAKVAEPRCLRFYGENMRLKRVAKK